MNPRMILLEGDRFWILCLFPIMHRLWYESDDADSILDGGSGYSHVNSVRVVFFIVHRVLVRQLIIPIIVYYCGGFEQIMERSSDAGV